MTVITAKFILPEAGKIPQWQAATWEDYVAACENPSLAEAKIFFHEGYLWINMGNEGPQHARFNDLFTIIFFVWFTTKVGQTFDSLSGCVIEKSKVGSGAPDKVLYIGGDFPQWQKGEPRRINLNQWRVPDLVAEISDTTLTSDLDEKKRLYAALGIPEYWVVDINGVRVLAFRLQENGKYQECEFSVALEGLPIALLSETLKLLTEGNGTAAMWFAQQIGNL
ncbi:MAG: Uma2 family endonuclease [Microcoleus sp. PH2017_29_MFU_D_A]|jgi:Uma2 family endonuclease|uniref:Uma2 family endonuclease n=1 Tax=unclassified Microcoleus TaxID=2642155 RepID=UPI001DCABDAE|nr:MULTISPECIES: Uma2 family endonuclease [unclassified Microcoleus]MCC3419512.1 Uma2 family endonuclease [Microcoleus sp. PH2017_07_MST_O_A]MCC3428687.1 Uma2 family endonuclease [Microcoleus sp. PH2017_04_SCI_O_A]MCC3442689.1 Uma2 family endonuclease [Microcoleus sp. PH2017_03_ELD_O_A]MCC3467131.1 Uma2 family endonuclease [Microcoleus sp. PH2017_06_SFM_O_A]MCC3505997.1 Uma2 family endonuclease [Microcoleus sp. PH2017_19_SFW_U_A]MCC3510243.1 Uma2 family endonuclease [Microcoleus sp. PH2017_17